MSGRRCRRCLVVLSRFEQVYCAICEDLSIRGISPSSIVAFHDAKRFEREESVQRKSENTNPR